MGGDGGRHLTHRNVRKRDWDPHRSQFLKKKKKKVRFCSSGSSVRVETAAAGAGGEGEGEIVSTLFKGA